MLSVDLGFPGANAELVAVDDARGAVTIRPGRRAGWSPHRGWFHCRLAGLDAGRRYELRVVEDCWAGVAVWRGTDGSWRHFDDWTQESDEDFRFGFVAASRAIEVALMPPYDPARLDAFVARIDGHPDLAIETFWRSEEGRIGRRLRIGAGAGRPVVWITARMHAFEAVASWVAEGLVAWALSDDPLAIALRGRVEISVVPMMDVDAVARGDSGKHRPPIDFARDAGSEPWWAAMRAVCAQLDAPPLAYLDLHGPGGRDTDVYFFAPPVVAPHRLPALQDFARRLGPLLPSRLPYTGRIFHVPDGVDDRGQSYAGALYAYLERRFADDRRLRLSVAIETPWSRPGYDVAAFMEAGAAYGRALAPVVRW